MSHVNDKELKQYFKQIKLLLPLYRRKEKQFLKDLKCSVDDYIQANPDCTFKDIVMRFETPQKIVSNYLSALDIDDLCKQISLRRYIKRTVLLLIILCLLAFLVHMGMVYKIYLNEQNQIVTEEVTVIE